MLIDAIAPYLVAQQGPSSSSSPFSTPFIDHPNQNGGVVGALSTRVQGFKRTLPRSHVSGHGLLVMLKL